MCCPNNSNQAITNFLKQELNNNNSQEKVITIQYNLQSLRDKYNFKKKQIALIVIMYIDQSYKNKNAQRMIMSEMEVQQFKLAYSYRNIKHQEPFSQITYKNLEYTFKLISQVGLEKEGQINLL